MLFHKCGNKLSPIFTRARIEIISGFILKVDEGVIPAGKMTFAQINKRDISSVVLYCSECGKENIPISEIVSMCSECGQVLPIADLRINSAQVICCQKHMAEYYPERRAYILGNVISKNTSSK